MTLRGQARQLFVKVLLGVFCAHATHEQRGFVCVEGSGRAHQSAHWRQVADARQRVSQDTGTQRRLARHLTAAAMAARSAVATIDCVMPT